MLFRSGMYLNIFGEGVDLMASNMFKYMPHGIMIGAGLVSLIQCGRMLFKKSDGDSAAGKFTSSMANMKKALGGGYVAYLVVAVLLAVITGIWSEMGVVQLVIWVIFSAFAAIASELIVGISAMYSGWFPGFATALIFLIVGMLIGFPSLPLGILVAYTSATGPAFSDSQISNNAYCHGYFQCHWRYTLLNSCLCYFYRYVWFYLQS